MRTSNWLLIGLLFLFGCGTNSTAPTPKAAIQGQVFLGMLVTPPPPHDSLLSGAIVTTSPPTDSVKTNAQGRYVLNVPPGRYTLGVCFDNMNFGVTSDTVIAIAGRVDTVNLNWMPEICNGCGVALFTIKGTIRSVNLGWPGPAFDTMPVENAKVVIKDTAGQVLDSAFTLANGSFSMTPISGPSAPVQPDKWILEVRDSVFLTKDTLISIPSYQGDTSNVELYLQQIPVTFTQTSSTVVSGNGLSLTLSIDSTGFQPGQQITVTISEKNTLPIENSVKIANNWPVQGLELYGCESLIYPFGISILQGNYDLENVASITPLQIYDPTAVYNCPEVPAGVTAYDFQPSSDTGAMIIENSFAGYWVGSPQNATFTNFIPGIYTVVGGDEWGALVILHFVIS